MAAMLATEDGSILKETLLQANGGRTHELPVLKEEVVQSRGSHRRSHYSISNDTNLKFSE